ncbi:glycoprotein [Wuhan Fly Virus 2]|uniref:Glycoprotein n=1 Tax=Wuhan Fly Virus 2 TaxID=1608102 RepID=A0A0B5KK73_9RHAB|nr:glycoprotein [Wuhan Fly Virus 2]AJG39160.1 glycoprotein [Wuhan Fly Virus 2]
MKKINTREVKITKMYAKLLIANALLIVTILCDILYPTDFSHNLLPVVPEKVLCPVGHLHRYPEAVNQFKVSYSRLAGFSEKKVKGKLCHKFILTTTCDEDILWSKSITYTMQNAKIDPSECYSAVKKAGDVLDTVVEHPPPACSWAQTISMSSEFVQVKDHPVSYDPYSGNLVDAIFPEGKTFDTEHHTIYDSGYWVIGESLDPEKYTQFEHGFGVIYFPDDWNPRELLIENARFWSERFRERDFVGACRLKFRGEEGVRFRNGEWFSFSFVEERHKSYFVWWSNLSICRSAESRVKIADTYENEHHTVESLAALMFYDRCQSSLSKLRNNMALTPLDVSYLAQTYPGVGPAYIITNTGLKMFLSHYELIKKYSTYDGQSIGKTSAEKNVIFGNWTVRSNITHGPNGLILKGNQLIFPAFSEMRSQIETELTQEITLEEVHITEIVNGTHKIMTSFDTIHRNPDQIDVLHVVQTGVSSISRWIGSIGAKIVTYTIVIVVLSLTAYLAGLLAKRYCRIRSQTNSQVLIPLSTIRPQIRTNSDTPMWFN